MLDLTEKPFYLSKEQEENVRRLVSKMSNQEKIGQLFVVLGDAYSTQELETLVSEKYIGGVLFRPDETKKVRKKYEHLQKMAKYPLLRAANLEEGGAGVLTDGTFFASEMQVAAADDLMITKEFAAICAEEGKTVGVNWNYAPVVDIDMNFRNPITNVRTFGSNVDKVREHACAYVETLQEHGMAAACKHFPGDGVDYRDQHLHPSYNSLSAKDWYDTYGSIYQAVINAGLMSIMVGHIIQPNVIKDVNPEAEEKDFLPGSLSREMLTGVLRQKFGFQGLIITDATIMGGFTMAMERKKAIPWAIAAGNDMLCFSTDIYEDMQYLQEGLQDGILSEERLDAAVTRVLAMKMALDVRMQEKQRDVWQKQYTGSEAKELAANCAEQSITLVKNKENLIPVSPENYQRVRLMVVGDDKLYDGSITQVAETCLRDMGFMVEVYDPMCDDLHGTSRLPKDRLNVLILHYPTISNQVTVRPQWCEKHALEIPRFVNEEKTIAISLANPYHLQDIPRVQAYINTYTATKVNLELALRKMVSGKFTGHSPVDAFCGLYDTRL